MDLRMNRHFQLKKSKVSAFLHIINLYNQKNLRKFDIGATDDNDNLVPDGKGGYLTPRGDKYWFGILPVIGVSWEFWNKNKRDIFAIAKVDCQSYCVLRTLGDIKVDR